MAAFLPGLEENQPDKQESPDGSQASSGVASPGGIPEDKTPVRQLGVKSASSASPIGLSRSIFLALFALGLLLNVERSIFQ